MRQAIRNFLKDEERAYRVLIDGAVTIVVVGFVVALCAIFLMK